MHRLLAGLRTFQDHVFPRHRTLFEHLYRNQAPECLFITCSDSRVVPNLILQAEPGELFVLRNVGNIVPPPGQGVGGTISGIEYAIDVLRVRSVILCGHSDCGAMRGILHPESVAHLPNVTTWVRHGEPAREAVDRLFPGVGDDEKLERLVEQNVILQVGNLLSHACVRRGLDEGRITLHGWVFDILTGRMKELNETGDGFIDVHTDTTGEADEKKQLLDLEFPSSHQPDEAE